MNPLQIVTWNVNSIKARLSLVGEWIAAARPDIVCFQEIKCLKETFPYEFFEDLGYNIAVLGQKSYNGVAVLSRTPIEEIIEILPQNPDPEQARYIEIVTTIQQSVWRVASVYVPNGMEVGCHKFEYKLAFLDALYHHVKHLLTYEEKLVLGGDFNIAPEALDVFDPMLMNNGICFHPEEHKRWRALCYLGMKDAFRECYPEMQAFSWWDYRGGSWAKNQGLRIDHLLVSSQAADCLKDVKNYSEERTKEKCSDHIPVGAFFTLKP